MKKITLLLLLVINSLFLSGCLPTVSTLSTAISVNNDRRTAGEVLDDRTIAFKLFAWPSTDAELNEAHLNFMVYGKTVLITGETQATHYENMRLAKQKHKMLKLNRYLMKSQLAQIVAY